MPRRKISEFRSKNIINSALGLSYLGWEVIDGQVPSIGSKGTFVLKVDQAVKQRFKRGLIYLDLPEEKLAEHVDILLGKGYKSQLIEPYHVHDGAEERYLSIVREREGVALSYSRQGGVDIEESGNVIKRDFVDNLDMNIVSEETGLSRGQIGKLIEVFDEQYMSLLEINPYTVVNGEVKILDVAIEVDSVAELLATEWNEDDFRSPAQLSEEEIFVKKLDHESPASFSLEVINPDGAIFLMLSGGGASVVIADEIFVMGHGKELANYGEYSGNPNTDETELYTEQIMKLLLKSKAKKKVVLIGGAVANFTDIKNTFKGIINVLEKYKDELRRQGVKFYVRRGGPRQAEGLKAMAEALGRMDLNGGVYDPETTIPTAVKSLVKGLK